MGTTSQTVSDPYKVALKSTVELEEIGSDGHGTGVVVNDKCVLTAEHVVGNNPFMTAIDSDGTSYTVKVVATDKKEDIAVACATNSLGLPATTLRDSTPAKWEKVFTIGYPFSWDDVLTEGRWQGQHLITAQAAPGNSGGGVFDMNGKYVGFCDAIAIEHVKSGDLTFGHLTIIVANEEIVPFLTTNKIEYHHG